MPDLRYEMEQLQAADAHIATAERDIARMQAVLVRQRQCGAETAVSEEALAAALRGLEVFRAHRALIAGLIDDMQSGRLPRD